MFAILRFLHLKLNKRHNICAAEYCQEMNKISFKLPNPSLMCVNIYIFSLRSSFVHFFCASHFIVVSKL